jgi:hypothetical protein
MKSNDYPQYSYNQDNGHENLQGNYPVRCNSTEDNGKKHKIFIFHFTASPDILPMLGHNPINTAMSEKNTAVIVIRPGEHACTSRGPGQEHLVKCTPSVHLVSSLSVAGQVEGGRQVVLDMAMSPEWPGLTETGVDTKGNCIILLAPWKNELKCLAALPPELHGVLLLVSLEKDIP